MQIVSSQGILHQTSNLIFLTKTTTTKKKKKKKKKKKAQKCLFVACWNQHSAQYLKVQEKNRSLQTLNCQ